MKNTIIVLLLAFLLWLMFVRKKTLSAASSANASDTRMVPVPAVSSNAPLLSSKEISDIVLTAPEPSLIDPSTTALQNIAAMTEPAVAAPLTVIVTPQVDLPAVVPRNLISDTALAELVKMEPQKELMQMTVLANNIIDPEINALASGMDLLGTNMYSLDEQFQLVNQKLTSVNAARRFLIDSANSSKDYTFLTDGRYDELTRQSSVLLKQVQALSDEMTRQAKEMNLSAVQMSGQTAVWNAKTLRQIYADAGITNPA